MQLALDGSQVPTELVERGNVRPLTEILPALRATGVRFVSPTGILGDPTGANADEGAGLLEVLALRLIRDVEAFARSVPA